MAYSSAPISQVARNSLGAVSSKYQETGERTVRWKRLVSQSIMLLALAGLVYGLSRAGRNSRSETLLQLYHSATLEGDSVSFAELRGRVVLLNVWATWCVPCMREAPQLQRLYDRFRRQGLIVVGVSIDAAGNDKSVRDFVNAFGLTYNIWHDPEQRVMTALGVVGVPWSVLIDAHGRRKWQMAGAWQPNDAGLLRVLTAALAETRPSL